MKLYLILATLGMAIIFWLISHDHDSVRVIKSNVDERGLISVVYTKGNDTFAMDYLTLEEYRKLTGQ